MIRWTGCHRRISWGGNQIPPTKFGVGGHIHGEAKSSGTALEGAPAVSLFLALSRSRSLALALSVCLSRARALSLSLSPSLPLSLSLPPSVSLCFPLVFSLSRPPPSLSLSPPLSCPSPHSLSPFLPPSRPWQGSDWCGVACPRAWRRSGRRWSH